MKRSIKLAIIGMAVLLALVAFFAYEQGFVGGDSCCHVKAQDPEEGNPGHKEPTESCSHTPEGKQVACKCRRQCENGVENESKACKSYCFRHFCLCKNPPCT